jgi:hypothetical protein
MKTDMPNFEAWSHTNLANFSKESYTRLQLQEEAIEQLRLDLRAAMNEIRTLSTNKDDWK